MESILSVLVLVSLIFSIIYVVRQRKAQGITGLKTALTSICFFLVAITNLLAYWFDFLGIWSWVSTIGLLLLGAYFTKYLHPAHSKDSGSA
ncbi:hypothetical protein AWM68_02990 [Fictibacillus phosphorivorans]|uniref:Uncharacterized protein n=1 Tax=Fictibacillus phosphorivorans TaxID=1221500 RepID=A0A163SJN9_9BACL|nr:hypothetical protein [Fictibacillus phosphorivorans]KZE69248.1 hypothetical protein AWM68_02990 [Fictibacillus phosphorivorans]